MKLSRREQKEGPSKKVAGQTAQEKMDGEIPSMQIGEGSEGVASSVRLNLPLLWASLRSLLPGEARAR